MKKSILTISCFILFRAMTGIAHAQDDSPKFDAAFQLSVLDIEDSIGEKGLAAGGRFGYRLMPLVYLDAEVVHFPADPSGNYGETLGLAGIRIGTEYDRFGVFAKVRAGAIGFGGRAVTSLLSKTTHPAIDLGTAIEFYANKGFFARLDVGDCIIPFGNTTYRSPEGHPNRLGTKHNLLTEFGFGFRF